MCGIAGLIDTNPPAPAVLEAMRDTLAHRGPDDAGLWFSPDRQVGLAHRRLSILDLSPAGHQPMLDDEADLAVVYNGEIYNYTDLQEELRAAGHRFTSTCDTEVLLAAYRQWGLDAIPRLNGMFALAIYDGRGRKVLFARDRAGQKPLYYRLTSGGMRFASECKALLAEPGCPRQIDRDALEDYLAYGYVPSPRCMLAGLAKLPPAHVGLYDLDDKSFRTKAYWSLPSHDPSAQLDEASCQAELHELLRDSVRRRLVADVPVGILLSGGVDSSLVTAAAAECSNRPVKTFNIAFPGQGSYDESAHARRIASAFGTEHIELAAEPASVDLLPDLARQFDEPMADSSMVPTFIVSRLIRQHATVALGGDGGDELFGGYPYHQFLQKVRWASALPGWLRSVLRPAARWLRPLGCVGHNALQAALLDAPHAIAQANLFLDARRRNALLARRLRRPIDRCLAPEHHRIDAQAPYDSIVQCIAAVDFRCHLSEDILVKVDRASMLPSLELRSPLLDPRIIDLAYARTPDTLRATAQEKKIILRRLARTLLPPEIDLDRKQGFSLPLQAWFAGPWGDFCREVLAGADPNLLERSAVDRLLVEQRKGRRHTPRIFALTMLELWRREYNIAPPDDAPQSA
jgi:asparagine synthase (glutamine-hydrolysing)